MSQTIKHFYNRRGEVDVIFDGVFYDVKYTTYSNLRTGAPHTERLYRNLDAVIAAEYFAAFVNTLKGKPVQAPKTYCEKCKKMCCEKNCPPKMGGANYWRIFQESCVFRKSR